MKHIQFSDLTNRLRRNLVASAFLIIAIAGFDISIEKAASGGLQFENLTTDVVLLLLMGFLLYHLVVFGVHAFEDYRHWELTFSSREEDRWDAPDQVVNLVGQLQSAAEALKNLSGPTSVSGTNITADDVAKIQKAAEDARIYGQRLKNFPRITRFRFWVLDIGMAGVLALFAVLFGLSVFPRGTLENCLGLS